MFMPHWPPSSTKLNSRTSKRRTARRRKDTRPLLETLEDRTLLSTGLFSSTFGNQDTDHVDSVDGWIDGDGDGNLCYINDANPRVVPQVPPFTDQHGRVREQCGIIASVTTVARTNVHLTYYWRGDIDAESNDELVVEFRVGTSGAFTTLLTHVLDDGILGNNATTIPGAAVAPSYPTTFDETSNWGPTIVDLTLPVSAENQAVVQIRFRGNTNDSHEHGRVDDVSITADQIPDSILIVKDAVPDDCQNFNFSQDITNFPIPT